MNLRLRASHLEVSKKSLLASFLEMRNWRNRYLFSSFFIFVHFFEIVGSGGMPFALLARSKVVSVCMSFHEASSICWSLFACVFEGFFGQAPMKEGPLPKLSQWPRPCMRMARVARLVSQQRCAKPTYPHFTVAFFPILRSFPSLFAVHALLALLFGSLTTLLCLPVLFIFWGAASRPLWNV